MRNLSSSSPRPVRRLWLITIGTVTALLAACGASGEETTTVPSVDKVQSLHDALPRSVQDSGVLRFAGDSHPPYRTVGSDGTITGLDADLQTALSQVLGVRVETSIVGTLPAALQGMLSGRYDAFNGPVKATAEREQQFDTITWMTTRTSYVIPTDSGSDVESADDLCGRRVAVASGSVVEEQLGKLSEYCTDNGRKAAVSIGLDDTNATMLAARSGRADAAGMTQAAAIDVTQEQGEAYRYVTQTDDQGATSDNLALFVPKDSGLGPVLRDAFQKLFEDGAYRTIMRQYGLDDVMVDKPLLNVASDER